MTIAEQEIEVQEVRDEQVMHATEYASFILKACNDFGSVALTLGVAVMGAYILTLSEGEKEDTLHAALFSFGLFSLSFGAICKTIPAICSGSNEDDNEDDTAVVPMV